MKPGRWLSYFVAAALSLLAVSIGMTQILFRWHVKPHLERDRSAQERHFQSYLEDIQFLSRAEILAVTKTREANAGLFLNSRVYWSPPVDGFPATPKVAKTLSETLFRFRGDWMRKYERAKHMRVDLSIFSDLSRFDHWDLEEDSPISKLTRDREFVPPPQLPIPETSDLLSLVKLRLMNGALNGDFLKALSDVRHLARLMLSTENTQLVLAGLAALDYERYAYRFYVEERGMAAKGWIPVDRNITRRAHRATLATRSYLHLWTDGTKLESIYLGPLTPVGFCAAANEAFPLEYALRSRLEPRWPMEMALNREYNRLDRIFARARRECRLRYLSELVSHGAIRVRVPGPLVLTRLPYARKVFGLRSSVISFQGFEAYEAAAL